MFGTVLQKLLRLEKCVLMAGRLFTSRDQSYRQHGPQIRASQSVAHSSSCYSPQQQIGIIIRTYTGVDFASKQELTAVIYAGCTPLIIRCVEVHLKVVVRHPQRSHSSIYNLFAGIQWSVASGRQLLRACDKTCQPNNEVVIISPRYDAGNVVNRCT